MSGQFNSESSAYLEALLTEVCFLRRGPPTKVLFVVIRHQSLGQLTCLTSELPLHCIHFNRKCSKEVLVMCILSLSVVHNKVVQEHGCIDDLDRFLETES